MKRAKRRDNIDREKYEVKDSGENMIKGKL
jgi:hypothetical protein